MTLSVAPFWLHIEYVIALMAFMLSPCVSGRVVDAKAGRPIAQAIVYAVWTPAGNAKAQITGDTKSDAQGRYRICVKGDGSALVQAHLGTANAFAQVPSTRGDTVLTDLRLRADGDSTWATVWGRVVSVAGTPVAGAAVTFLGGGPRFAPTANDGTFALTHVPVGSQMLVVRSIGSSSAIIDVDLVADSIRTVNVTMDRAPPTLAVVTIMADRLHLGDVYDRIGFSARRRVGNGRFMSADDIERRDATTTPQLFERVVGLRVHDNHDDTYRVFEDRGVPTIYANGGTCTAYVIDGSLVGNGQSVSGNLAGGPDENVLPLPRDLIAVEIYSPAQPAPTPVGIADRCLKIYLWTKANLRK